MRTLFDTAKAATWIAPDELETLFEESSYEARMAALCILDFQARKRLGDLGLRDTYLRHHDRIDDWGMVDRAAPSVIGFRAEDQAGTESPCSQACQAGSSRCT